MKNGINNKVIFITALGFYFGLMLTGAAPSAFARQAGMPRSFDIRDEIDFSDDLDKSPDAGKTIDEFAAALIELYRVALEASEKYPGAIEEGSLDFKLFQNVFQGGGGRSVSWPENNGKRTIYSGKSSKWLFRLYDSALPRAKTWKENYRIDFVLSPEDVSLQTNLFTGDAKIAKDFARAYDEALLRRREIETDTLKSLIYSTIEIFVEDTHVAIVTRLPRGSIDPLIFTHASKRHRGHQDAAGFAINLRLF